MSEAMLHIASAVVKAWPAQQGAVVSCIAAFAGAEVMAVDQGRIIVVLEARHQYGIGDLLNRITNLDGVLSATLVFEHTEPEGDLT